MNTEFNLAKSLMLRFVRGFVAGAVSAMAVINITSVNTFSDLKTFLAALAFAAISGGVTGGVMTLDKYFRSQQ